MPETTDPQRRLLVTADMESYSRRTNLLQFRAQAAFHKIMDDATTELGLERVNWLTQQGGDGELSILPPGTSERLVVARLIPVLDRLLRLHNEGLGPDARVRLRVAIHQGLVHLDGANGYPGEAVVHVCRLVDAPPVKSVLRQFTRADVVLIVSDSMYREVVQNYPDLRPDRFAEITAELPDKGFRATAWIYVPGENAAAGQTEAHPEQPKPVVPPPSGAGQSFSNITTHAPASFGNHNTINDAGRWGLRPESHR